MNPFNLNELLFKLKLALDPIVREPHRPRDRGSLGTICPLLPPQHDAQRFPLRLAASAQTSRCRKPDPPFLGEASLSAYVPHTIRGRCPSVPRVFPLPDRRQFLQSGRG